VHNELSDGDDGWRGDETKRTASKEHDSTTTMATTTMATTTTWTVGDRNTILYKHVDTAVPCVWSCRSGIVPGFDLGPWIEVYKQHRAYDRECHKVRGDCKLHHMSMLMLLVRRLLLIRRSAKEHGAEPVQWRCRCQQSSTDLHVQYGKADDQQQQPMDHVWQQCRREETLFGGIGCAITSIDVDHSW
jgi:hypothetical protein